MDMTSMKMDSQEKSTMEKNMVVDQPDYPYGLCLHLDENAIKKLGMKMPKVGDSMMLHAMVTVKSTSQFDSKESGANRSMDMQITDMAMMPAKGKKSAAKALYGSDDTDSDGM